MKMFKEGDRVRCIECKSIVPVGATGTVLESERYMPYVEWDNFYNGHCGPFNDGRQTVWAVHSEEITLIEVRDGEEN